MKRICEIYDISKDYEMPTGTVLIIVSDIEKDKIISMLLNTEMKEDMIFNNTEWQEYLEINNKYNRNEAKYQMREIRQSKRLESDVSHIYEIDIGESLENEEIEMYLKKFMLNLKPVQRRRFKMYYIDNLTYRQIADIESRNIKSIYESVQAGKNKFLKYSCEKIKQGRKKTRYAGNFRYIGFFVEIIFSGRIQSAKICVRLVLGFPVK